MNMIHHLMLTISNMTGVTSGAGTDCNSRALKFFPGFKWSLCYSISSVLSSVLWIVVYLFVLFVMSIVLSVLLQIMASDYHFSIIKTFLMFKRENGMLNGIRISIYFLILQLVYENFKSDIYASPYSQYAFSLYNLSNFVLFQLS